MVKTLAPALCALSAVALGACSQQSADFMPESTPSASAPAAPGKPAPALPAAAQRASTLIGLPVRSPSGARLGAVLDIVFGNGGKATHLIAVRAAAGGAPGSLTSIPWALAIRHLHDGVLVLDAKRFAGAPSFAVGHWPKLGTQDWSAAADTYWSRTRPHAFKPIDSTKRSRARPPLKL